MVRADAFSEGRLRLTGAGRARQSVLLFIINVIELMCSCFRNFRDENCRCAPYCHPHCQSAQVVKFLPFSSSSLLLYSPFIPIVIVFELECSPFSSLCSPFSSPLSVYSTSLSSCQYNFHHIALVVQSNHSKNRVNLT